MWRKVAAFVVFQTIWFAAVIYGPQGNPWPAIVLTVILGALLGQKALPDWRIIVAFAAAGTLLDLLWLNSGLITYPYRGDATGWQWPPIWIATLWIGVGMTLTNLLGWTMRSPQLAVLAGAAGSLSYLGAIRLEAVAMPNVTGGISALALAWALLFTATWFVARQKALANIAPALAANVANRAPSESL
jgi:hypothetical protein